MSGTLASSSVASVVVRAVTRPDGQWRVNVFRAREPGRPGYGAPGDITRLPVRRQRLERVRGGLRGVLAEPAAGGFAAQVWCLMLRPAGVGGDTRFIAPTT
jgi:hypothetical protein